MIWFSFLLILNPILHRDRENATVFVADLPSGVTEEELSELFKDVSPVFFRSILSIHFLANSVARSGRSRLPSYPIYSSLPSNFWTEYVLYLSTFPATVPIIVLQHLGFHPRCIDQGQKTIAWGRSSCASGMEIDPLRHKLSRICRRCSDSKAFR